jgi:hypothetical protein
LDIEHIIAQMRSNGRAIAALVAGYSDEQARRKPDSGAWSVLEVVNHLLDEEREDFRPRIDVMLQVGREVWFPIDPEGWVTRRAYNRRELAPSLGGFLAAREESLVWLEHLEDPAWEAEYEAPWGRIRAGDILAAWAAHDVLHMRQLVELKWATLVQTVEPYSVRYAGEW